MAEKDLMFQRWGIWHYWRFYHIICKRTWLSIFNWIYLPSDNQTWQWEILLYKWISFFTEKIIYTPWMFHCRVWLQSWIEIHTDMIWKMLDALEGHCLITNDMMTWKNSFLWVSWAPDPHHKKTPKFVNTLKAWDRNTMKSSWTCMSMFDSFR